MCWIEALRRRACDDDGDDGDCSVSTFIDFGIEKNLLVMRHMMVVMARMRMLVALRPSDTRCTSSIVAIGIKDILVLDALRLSALLRVYAL